MVSFAVQKLISFIRFHLFIFALISFALGDWSKKILLEFMPENFLPMFSSRSFLVSCLILSLFLCMVWGSILTSLIHIFLTFTTPWTRIVYSHLWASGHTSARCRILSHFWSLVQTLLCHDLPARVVPTSAGPRSTVSITSVIQDSPSCLRGTSVLTDCGLLGAGVCPNCVCSGLLPSVIRSNTFPF